MQSIHWFLFSIFLTLSIQVSAQEKKMEAALLEEVNQFRKQNRALPLKKEKECLNEAALHHAKYLSKQKELSHFQDNKKSKTPVDRVKNAGCENLTILENVAFFRYDEIPDAATSAEKLFDLWYKSKGHRNNMMNKNVEFIGNAVLIDQKNKRIIAVQVYAN